MFIGFPLIYTKNHVNWSFRWQDMANHMNVPIYWFSNNQFLRKKLFWGYVGSWGRIMESLGWGSSVASNICQDRAKWKNVPNFSSISWFFPSFSLFFLIFSLFFQIFGKFFAVKGALYSHWPPVMWLCHWDGGQFRPWSLPGDTAMTRVTI